MTFCTCKADGPARIRGRLEDGKAVRSGHLLSYPLHGVDNDAVDAHLPVQVGGGRAPGVADRADLLPGGDGVTGPDENGGLVAVAGVHTPAVGDDGDVAARVQQPCIDDYATLSGVDRRA